MVMSGKTVVPDQSLTRFRSWPAVRGKDGGRCVLVRVALPPYPLSNLVAGLVGPSAMERSVRAI